jgi:hypothetical protein
MGDIGDMHPHLPLSIAGCLDADRVIEILGIIRIDGDHLVSATIFTPGNVSGLDGGPYCSRFLENGFGKMQFEVVLAKDRKHIDAFGVGRAKDFEDLSFGIRMAGRPLRQLHHDLVSNSGGAPNIRGRGHVNILGNSGVVRDNVKESIASLQRADELCSRLFKDTHHTSIQFPNTFPRGPTIVKPGEDAIAMHCGLGGIRRNAQHGNAWSIRLNEAGALAINPYAARDQIGVLREGKAVALLYASDFTAALQSTEGLLQLSLFVGIPTQEMEQLRDPERFLSMFLKQREKFFFPRRSRARFFQES